MGPTLNLAPRDAAFLGIVAIVLQIALVIFLIVMIYRFVTAHQSIAESLADIADAHWPDDPSGQDADARPPAAPKSPQA